MDVQDSKGSTALHLACAGHLIVLSVKSKSTLARITFLDQDIPGNHSAAANLLLRLPAATTFFCNRYLLIVNRHFL